MTEDSDKQLSNVKNPDAYYDLRDAARTLNAAGKAFMNYTLEEFKAKWLSRFVNDTDGTYRQEWVRTVAASPFAEVHLLDKKGNLAVIVPAMARSTGRFLPAKLNIADFLGRYTHAKTYANGYRAVQMMQNLAKDGVLKADFPEEDIRTWIDFYDYFGTEPEWIAKAREIIEEIDAIRVQNNASTNDTDSGSTGISNDGFGSTDEYEDL